MSSDASDHSSALFRLHEGKEEDAEKITKHAAAARKSKARIVPGGSKKENGGAFGSIIGEW